MEFRYWATTDVGRKRADNEDNFLIDKALNLFIVADGMGGHASGEVASAMAVYTVRDTVVENRDILAHYSPDDPLAQMEICTLLEFAVHRACESVHRKALQEPEKKGMGTTVVALWLIGERGFIAYVGDSRIYLLRHNTIYPLTEDHSLRNELIRSGQVRAEEFAESPYARYQHAMTRAVGVHPTVDVDVLDFDLVSGDAFLLCSDGLYEYLHDADIASYLSLPDVEEIPRRFIELANTRGGKDNITALIVKVTGEDDVTRPSRGFSVDTLRALPLMAHLSYQQLCRMMSIAKLRSFSEGELLLREDEPGGELVIVLEGKVATARGGVVVRELGPGEFFGEGELSSPGPRTVTATGLAKGKLLTIGRADFQDMLQRDSRLASKLLWNLATLLGARVADLSEQLSRRTETVVHELHEVELHDDEDTEIHEVELTDVDADVELADVHEVDLTEVDPDILELDIEDEDTAIKPVNS